MSKSENFKGKYVCVTGGSRGIGKSIALEFAQNGCNIAFNYLRNHDSAERTKQEITDLGVKCLKIKAHLGKPEKIQEMFKIVGDEFGKLDILINNAASGVQRSAESLEPKHWDWPRT